MTDEPLHPTHIVVTNLNKLRWIVYNQILLTNVFLYTPETVTFLENNEIPFYLAHKKWDEYIRLPERIVNHE